jgi:hypothetical protein
MRSGEASEIRIWSKLWGPWGWPKICIKSFIWLSFAPSNWIRVRNSASRAGGDPGAHRPAGASMPAAGPARPQ